MPRFFVVLLGLVTVMAACAPDGSSPSPSTVAPAEIIEAGGVEVIRIPELGVVCFWKAASYKAGLDCIPEHELEAPDTD